MLRLRRHKSVSDPVAVVNRFVDAANRHDAAGIAKCLHPDFESIQPVYPSRNFKGSEQVRRNWQAIFQSEPGFRLSLVRSAASDGTVWVELHGAGSAVEVAGVFIMGVEDDLVRWARVYSSVVEQPAAVIDDTVEATKMAAAPPSPQDEAEELRRTIEAGRQAAALLGDAAPGDGDAGVDAGAEGTADESTAEPEIAAIDEGEEPKAPVSLDKVDKDETTGDETTGDETTGDEVTGDEVSKDSATEEAADEEAAIEVIDVVGGNGEADATASEEDTTSGRPETAEVAEPSQRSEDESPEVRAAVGEVQALAETARPRRSRSRKRPPRAEAPPVDEPTSESEPPADAVELNDATQVRAAARAATTKAASQPDQTTPDAGTGGENRKPRNKSNR